MTLSRRTLVLGFVALSIAGCGRPGPDIDAASVKRVISTLSADEMLGRAPFTPGIDKAAIFIRDEFESIGLEKIGEMKDYLQRFVVYRFQVQNRRIVLNGIEIPSERSTAWAKSPSVHWTSGDPGEVVMIGPGDDAGQKIWSIRMSDRRLQASLAWRVPLVLPCLRFSVASSCPIRLFWECLLSSQEH